MTRVHIGERLKALRGRAELSQKAFAGALGVHWRSVQDWEANRTAVDSYKAEALLKAAEAVVKKAKKRRASK